MLEKLYQDVAEKNFKTILSIYYGLLLSSIALPVVGLIIGYFLNGRIYFSKTLFIFLALIIWSLFNIEYFKKKIEAYNKTE